MFLKMTIPHPLSTEEPKRKETVVVRRSSARMEKIIHLQTQHTPDDNAAEKELSS
jgi:hypothetical protein